MSYTTAKALLTTKRVELINKKEFAKVVLDGNSKTFVFHVASFNLVSRIHLDRTAHISSFLNEEVKILDEYLDFANVFLEEKASVLLKHIELNEHIIKLENGKQLPYRPIYCLDLMVLETLKAYIKTHLKIQVYSTFQLSCRGSHTI